MIWKFNNGNFFIYKNNKLAGGVSQNPIHPDVMNPGMWTAVVHTADEGLIALSLSDTSLKARIKVAHALNRRWTYKIWMRWGEGNAQQRQRGLVALKKLMRMLRIWV